MKKTIFKGIVNGQEFNDVKSYNEAVSKAIEEGNLQHASTETRIEERCDCGCNEKQECKCNKPLVDVCPNMNFNFRGMMSQSPEELEHTLDEFKQAFVGLPQEYKDSMMYLIRDTKAIAERQLKVTEKDIDTMDAQIAELSEKIDHYAEKIDELEKQISTHEDEVGKLSERADDQQENYEKLLMVIDALECVMTEEPEAAKCKEEMSIGDLWKNLFGMAEKILKN